jgi:hypothetical protein
VALGGGRDGSGACSGSIAVIEAPIWPMAETWIRIAQDVQSDREATGNGGG